ncbi:hypothetical protein Cni_G09590 [Canna indica]|uniref:Uncharacterized protein n=1 Tax=Canna indica TaxID=4628 RepID=A0AAQ3K2S4_9LILI|nr:hypothetical protein Cni_G09590 [Canna indica]
MALDTAVDLGDWWRWVWEHTSIYLLRPLLAVSFVLSLILLTTSEVIRTGLEGVGVNRNHQRLILRNEKITKKENYGFDE